MDIHVPLPVLMAAAGLIAGIGLSVLTRAFRRRVRVRLVHGHIFGSEFSVHAGHYTLGN